MSEAGSGGDSLAARPVLAYVVNSLQPGGTEKLVIEMSRAFAGEFCVRVFCLDEPGLWADDLRRSGIPVVCLWRQSGLDLSICRKLARELRRCGAQIVHAHQCTPWFYTALSRLLNPHPRLLLEEHGRLFPEVDRPLRRLVNRLLIRRLTHRFVAVSKDVRRRLQQYEGLRGMRIEVIYNGVTAETPLNPGQRSALRADLGFDADAFVIGTVGRFDSIKNLPMLVRSLAAARTHAGRIRALLVGDGPELPAIRALIEDLGLTQSVRLTGFRSDARTLLQCMDLFVLSSLSEGTSMALLEAMAAGVPAAVTAVGGNAEVVRSGETGWLVPSGDVAALSAVIVEAAKSFELCSRLGAAARGRVEDVFAIEKMIASYRELYGSLLPAGLG